MDPEHRELKRPMMRQLPKDYQGTQDTIMATAEGAAAVTMSTVLLTLFQGVGL